MDQNIVSLNEFDSLVREKPAVLAYFSTAECSVCKVLKPKVYKLISSDFPEITTVFVEINRSPELAAQKRIFTVPTLIVYFDGLEFFRKSRNFGLNELRDQLQRPYDLMFS